MARNRPVPKWFLRVLTPVHRGLLRISGGRLAASFHGEPMILLSTTGARTGVQRTIPLSALREGDGWLVAASNGGSDVHPGWYANLRAHPEATVTVGGATVPVRARDASDAERAAYWPRFVEYFGGYAKYEATTDRAIPVVVLERIA